eukprot:3602046-Karenia_brevis.AAC.1
MHLKDDAQHCVSLRDFTSQNRASSVWTFASASGTFFDAIADVATVRLKEINCQELMISMSGFAKVCHALPAFFDAITEMANEYVQVVHDQHWVTTVGAFAVICHASVALFDAIANVET